MNRLSLLLFVSIFFHPGTSSGQNNLQLLSSYTISGQRLSGCWHYVDTSGNEYALIGAEEGIVFFDITDPAQPDFLFQLPGNRSIWHEVKVWGDYAYAVSEGVDTNGVMNGVQIMDLRYLPDSVPYKFWQGDGLIQNLLVKAHTVTVDSGFMYVNGHNINSLGNGVLLCSISDPWNPSFTGAIVNNYSHDSYVRGNRLFSSEIFAGQFSVYDITNPASPVLLASQVTPGAFNHNTWLNDAGNVLFTTDEQSNAPVAAYDITDLTNITLLDEYLTELMPNKEVHNVRVKDDYLINPSYGSQLTIADVSRSHNIVEIANYPTGAFLCWDADPFLASGAILATDMNSSTVFLFQPNYLRACYLEGLVTDSVSGLPLSNVDVTLTGTVAVKKSGLDGSYATGNSNSGLYSVSFSRSGYRTKTISGVSLVNGSVTNLDVELAATNIGYDELSSFTGLVVHPQPADAYFVVETAQGKDFDYSISDVSGRIWKEGSFPSTISSTAKIDTDELPSGVYILTISAGPGRAAGRIVVHH